jgi:small subunit ribosomal protein S6
MQVYETVLILKPVLSDPEVADAAEKIKKMMSADGGDIMAHEVWGRRKLTHMIGKNRDGVYVFYRYKATPDLLTKLEHNFSISETIIRHMTVVAQDRKLREKKKKAKAAPAPAAAAQ